MDREDLLYWMALQRVSGVGKKQYLRILEAFGGPRQATQAPTRQLMALPRMGEAVASQIRQIPQNLKTEEQKLAELNHRRVRVVTIRDAEYPDVFRAIEEPPPILYIRGSIEESDRRAVAIVGTTTPTARGRQMAEDLAMLCAKAGVTVVSGYAKGIDTAGHVGVLRAGGRTIAAICCGFDNLGMRKDFGSVNAFEKHGAIISEVYPTEGWTAGAALARNRLVVALSRAVMVVEAQADGGTMRTAAIAGNMQKPLFVLDSSTGNSPTGNAILLAQGATPVLGTQDVADLVRAVGD